MASLDSMNLGLASLFFLLATSAQSLALELNLTDLRCEYVKDPLAVDSSAPRLFWKLQSAARGQRQTAYRVLVASSAKLLAGDKGDLWDTGKVKSKETTHIRYAGKPLRSSQQVFPVKPHSEVSEDGQPVKHRRGIKFLRAEDGCNLYQVGSGTFEFLGVANSYSSSER